MTVGGRAVKPLVKAAFGGRSALADMGRVGVQVPARTPIGRVGDLGSFLCVVGRGSTGQGSISRNSDGVGNQRHATDRGEQHGEVDTEVLK
jgi:hypothetical protein